MRIAVVGTNAADALALIHPLTLQPVLRSALPPSRFRAMSLKWFPSNLRS
jgi:hypothetical protein